MPLSDDRWAAAPSDDGLSIARLRRTRGRSCVDRACVDRAFKAQLVGRQAPT